MLLQDHNAAFPVTPAAGSVQNVSTLLQANAQWWLNPSVRLVNTRMRKQLKSRFVDAKSGKLNESLVGVEWLIKKILFVSYLTENDNTLREIVHRKIVDF